jgi:hypothetical protein
VNLRMGRRDHASISLSPCGAARRLRAARSIESEIAALPRLGRPTQRPDPKLSNRNRRMSGSFFALTGDNLTRASSSHRGSQPSLNGAKPDINSNSIKMWLSSLVQAVAQPRSGQGQSMWPSAVQLAWRKFGGPRNEVRTRLKLGASNLIADRSQNPDYRAGKPRAEPRARGESGEMPQRREHSAASRKTGEVFCDWRFGFGV